MTSAPAGTGAPEFRLLSARHRFGLKGPSAPQWLQANGLPVPAVANTWMSADTLSDTLLVARLGSSEYFLEDGEGGTILRNLDPTTAGSRGSGAPAGSPPVTHPSGVYPVLRQDAAFLLSGDASLDVLAQVCNVNFGELVLESNPVIMTLMVGVSVLVIPQDIGGRRRFRIWCDPTLGDYLAESFGTVMAVSDGKST
jgi:sarcosine oxidase subunit gamma